MATTPAPTVGDSAFCTECGRTYATQDLVRIGNGLVCANCKNLYAQRMREGTMVTGAVQYGGFWRRGAALFLDGLILGVANFAVSTIIQLILGGPKTPTQIFTPALGITFLANIAIAIAYHVYFLTTNGATPGKMVLGLKVIRADGSPITGGIAVARYFAYFLDSVILGIGYIMAGFDTEKRALHDHICGTRVLRIA